MRNVLLLGATGLVGRELLAQLLDDDSVARVTVIARRATGTKHAKLDERVMPLDDMEKHAEIFAVDQVVSALGTTIKVAGSQEAFRHVDYELPLAAARLGGARGAKHFLLVSALGADSGSRIFYNRVKGELEDAVQSLGYRSVTIARPSLLLGERSEFRLGERVAERFAWLMPKAYKPVDARRVARALVEAGRADAPGMRVIENREM